MGMRTGGFETKLLKSARGFNYRSKIPGRGLLTVRMQIASAIA